MLFAEARPKRVDVGMRLPAASWQPFVRRGAGGGGALLNQLLCLEEAPQVEHLPRGQPDQATHGEHAEVQNTRVGGLWRSERFHYK